MIAERSAMVPERSATVDFLSAMTAERSAMVPVRSATVEFLSAMIAERSATVPELYATDKFLSGTAAECSALVPCRSAMVAEPHLLIALINRIMQLPAAVCEVKLTGDSGKITLFARQPAVTENK